MKIAFVLRLVDDFSGQCIQRKKFLFSIENRVVHPIEKPEGLYVFLEPQAEETKVRIESADYYPCSVLIQKKALNWEEPVADIRLYGRPGRNFSYTSGLLTGNVTKKGQKFPAEVYAKRTRPTGLTFREYRNVEGEHWVWFQGFTKESLLNKPYILGESKEAVPFILTEKRGINEYHMEFQKEPSTEFEPGAPLVRIYRSVTDATGAYAIPVDAGEETLIKEVILLHL